MELLFYRNRNTLNSSGKITTSPIPICVGFETFLPCQKPVTAKTVDVARWSYSPHGGGVTSLSATTLWWSLNFPWNGISVPYALPGSHGPRCLYMGHAERISFPIRWPTWKCSWITGEDTVIFVSLQQSMFISISNNLKDSWRMHETWGYTFWTHALPTHLDMYCVQFYKCLWKIYIVVPNIIHYQDD